MCIRDSLYSIISILLFLSCYLLSVICYRCLLSCFMQSSQASDTMHFCEDFFSLALDCNADFFSDPVHLCRNFIEGCCRFIDVGNHHHVEIFLHNRLGNIQYIHAFFCQIDVYKRQEQRKFKRMLPVLIVFVKQNMIQSPRMCRAGFLRTAAGPGCVFDLSEKRSRMEGGVQIWNFRSEGQGEMIWMILCC